MKKTKAAVLEATGGSLQLRELDIEPPRANEIAIRVVACGICHSDYSCIHGIVHFPRFLELYRKGELRLEAMITSRIALEDVNEPLTAWRRAKERAR